MELERLEALIDGVDRSKRLVFLVGAGFSAESGIPTFRGPEGYWTVGSTHYTPQEIGTWAMFESDPRQVWSWYLFRRGGCNAASPNDAHRALVALERARPESFRLITQNIDGLHVRAGNSPERALEIHGNGDSMRCAAGCSARRYPIPAEVPSLARDEPLPEEAFARLICPDCGGPARPHVLWFDERYEEELYRSQTALSETARADLLVVVGTSGATTLPLHAAAVAAKVGAAIVDINPNPNPFSRFAEEYRRGAWVQGGAVEWVPWMVDALISP